MRQTKERKREYYDRIAPEVRLWKKRNKYYYDDLEGFLSFVIPENRSVLEIGCGTGDLLARLRPSRGLGIDFSPKMVDYARKKFLKENCHSLDFDVGDAENLHIEKTFDYVVMSNLIGQLTDVGQAFRNLQKVTRPESRIVITYFNALWEPILWLGERLKLKMPQDRQNWLSLADIEGLLKLNDFEVIRKGFRFLLPKKIPLISAPVNRFLAKLPFIRNFCLVVYLVARPKAIRNSNGKQYAVSVIIPCRNEKGNIRPAVERIPEMGRHTEIIFVDGASTDGTVDEIEQVIKECRGKKDIKLIHQVSPGYEGALGHNHMLKLGKGDAVRKGFAAANGEVLMILDADLTVPPEELPKFYLAISEGHGEFINGTRLVYPMEKEAMRLLNKFGNKFFSLLFTWLLEQRIKDTLCGTKVLFKKDYERIAADRAFFGNVDPFGDFDLLFGAAKQNLKIVEVPIRYRERTYGEIKIQRFRHGLLLLKMSYVAMLKLKLK